MFCRIACAAILLYGMTSPAVAGSRVPFRHYSISEGLPHENVKALAQTADGRLWIGTSAGLSVFNGAEFIDIDFADLATPASVYELEAMPDGSLWVATVSHGVWFVQDGRATQPFPMLANERIHRFVLREDTLFLFGPQMRWSIDLATQTIGRSPYRYAAGTPQGAGIVSADIAADGTVWVLDGRLGPGRMMEDGVVHFRQELAQMQASTWRFLRFDMYGTGWVTHQHEGLYRIVSDGSLELVLAANGAEHICVTPDRIAVASGRLGGLMWDLQKEAPITPLDEQRGLPTNRINCLFRDNEGNTWIGTQDGLVQLINPGVEHVMEAAGQPLVELEGIGRAGDGSIWVASRTGGLVRVAPQPGVFQPAPDARWTALIDGQDGQLYALEDHAWYRFASAERWVQVGPHDGAIRGVVDGAGAGFFKQSDGLYRHDPDGTKDRLVNWLPDERMLYEHTLTPDGRLLVWDNGRLLDVEKQSSADTGVAEVRVIAEFPALRGVGVRTVAMDSGRRIWVSLQGRGLFCIQGDDVLFVLPDQEITRVEQLNDSLMAVEAHDGLHAFAFRQIDNGIRRLRLGNAVKKALTPRYHIGQSDGLLSSIVAGAVTSAEALWVAHPGGLTVMPLSVVYRELPPPTVLLTAVNLNGINNTPALPLRFSARDRNVGFSFSSTAFASQHRVYYRYRLRGFDNMWRETDENAVHYADLPSGSYQFEVQAGVEPNVFSQAVAYAFAIPRPFHEHPIVWASALLLLLGALYGGHRYRVRHLVHIERTRTQIAMDLHDDIGSSLMSLSLLSTMARQRSEQKEEVSPLLSEIGLTASALVDSMSDIVWAIDPMQDTFRSVIERLQGFAQRMTASSDIDIEWQIGPEIDAIVFPPRVRRNLYLIVKEAMTNAIKHSGSAMIVIRMRSEEHALTVEVEDSGKGLPSGTPAGGYGLRTMRMRAGKSGASLFIHAVEQGGTRVTVRCPFNAQA